MDERQIEWVVFQETLIHPLALTFVLLMGFALLLVRRQYAALPLVLVACLLPINQRFIVGGLDFDMSRIMLLFGWVRVLARGEYRDFRPSRLDRWLGGWVLISIATYVLRERSVSSMIYMLGVTFDAVGILLMFRMLVRGREDVFRTLKFLCWVAFIVALFMLTEHATGRNLFHVFGGVHEFSIIREGRLRAQGAFTHPIMAGCYGSSVVAMSIALIASGSRYRLSGIVGLIGGTIVALAPSSSGPAIAFVVVLGSWALWFARDWMAIIRWGALATLVTLHLVREAPVWHLIGRASDLVGGTGYHRYRLIDAFVNHWREWFIYGVNGTAHWGWGMQDITNQFVLEGVRGGFPRFAAFIGVVSVCFAALGATRKRAHNYRPLQKRNRRSLEFLCWGLGVTLVAHCVNWISVSYFGQMQVILYLTFALISSLSVDPIGRVRAPAAPTEDNSKAC